MPKDLEILITNMEPLEKAMQSNDRDAISDQLRIAAKSLRRIAESQTFFSAIYRNKTVPGDTAQVQISRLAAQLDTWGWNGEPILDGLHSLTNPTKDQTEEARVRAGLNSFARSLDDLSTKVLNDDTGTWKSALHQLWLSLRRIVISLCGIALIGQELFEIEGTVPWIATAGAGLLVSSLDEFFRWKSEQDLSTRAPAPTPAQIEGPEDVIFIEQRSHQPAEDNLPEVGNAPKQPRPGTLRNLSPSIDPDQFGFAAPGKEENLTSFADPTMQPPENRSDSGSSPGL